MNKLHQTCLICGSLCAIGFAYIIYQHQKIKKLQNKLEFETQRKLMEKSQQEIVNNPNLIFTQEQQEQQKQEQQKQEQQEQQKQEQQEQQKQEQQEQMQKEPQVQENTLNSIPESENIHENFNIDLSEHINNMFIPIELNPPTSSTQIEILEVNSEKDNIPIVNQDSLDIIYMEDNMKDKVITNYRVSINENLAPLKSETAE